MTKQEGKKLILDRAITKYPKSAVALLKCLLDSIYVKEWRTSNLEAFTTKELTTDKLSYRIFYSRRTVWQDLAMLISDGLVVRMAKDVYGLRLSSLAQLGSRTQQLLELKERQRENNRLLKQAQKCLKAQEKITGSL